MAASLDNLDPTFSGRLGGLMAEVKTLGGNLTVTSGHRSEAEQQYIIDHPETHPGRPVAPVGSSLHEKGLAADFEGDDKTLALMNQLAPKYGITGLKGDRGHFQLAGVQQLPGDTRKVTPEVHPSQLTSLPQRLNVLMNLFGAPASMDSPTMGGVNTSSMDTPQPTMGMQDTSAMGNQGAMTGNPTAPQAPGAPTGGGTVLQSSAPQAQQASGFGDLVDQAASKYGLDPRLLHAVIQQESGGNPTAHSPAGAQGLMQLMPATAKSLGVSDPFDPAQNVDAGARYLSQLISSQGGRVDLGLAAYNAGPGAVQQAGGIPNFPETQKYVKDIMSQVK